MYKNLYKLLDNLRTEKRLIELARFLGFKTQSKISDWLSGRITSYNKYLPQIAEFFNVSMDYITDKTDMENPQDYKDKLKKLLETPPGITRYTIVGYGSKGQINETIEISDEDIDTVKKFLENIGKSTKDE